MRRMPEPENTPQGPAYEGRLLARADEEVVDQGATFDITTLISRRSVLGLVALGAGAVTLAACSSASGSPAATSTPTATATAAPAASASPLATAAAATAVPAGELPQETAGPYPGDGSNGPDILEQSGIIRSDIRTSLDGGATAEGVPVTLTMTVLDMANGDVPFAGVAVYLWHCDSQGGYSMYSEGIEDQSYLRGVQVADANGQVTFSTIYPAAYDGRWPHMHFEVYPDAASITDAANAIATSQIAMLQDVSEQVYTSSVYSGSSENLARVSLASDNVFGDDGGALELPTVTGDAASGYRMAFTMRVDTATVATAGGNRP